MSFNPFLEKARSVEDCLMSWGDMFPRPYNKNEVSPYTKARAILMNGTEFEAVWCKHHFNRHFSDNEARRKVALLRRSEAQQQKLISLLKPQDESVLETTIGYEQLAVDLTAELARGTTSTTFKKALDFALLEDFDHLYRYADLLDFDTGIHAKRLVGSYTEIMPARPTIAHHRHPYDTVRPTETDYDLKTKLGIGIITAAEQQTMNYYMNLAPFYENSLGRELYAEIGMVEEDHVTHYGSLMDTGATPFENLLLHEYTECYLYYSMYHDETDSHIKGIWERLLDTEIAHLHLARKLLEKYEKKDFCAVVGKGDFPELLKLHENKDYVRGVLKNTVTKTTEGDGYTDVCSLPKGSRFFLYQGVVNKTPEEERGHTVIEDHISHFGKDYRFEEKENPIESLRCRERDNYHLGRVPNCENM
jgi:rubrerythrin